MLDHLQVLLGDLLPRVHVLVHHPAKLGEHFVNDRNLLVVKYFGVAEGHHDLHALFKVLRRLLLRLRRATGRRLGTAARRLGNAAQRLGSAVQRLGSHNAAQRLGTGARRLFAVVFDFGVLSFRPASFRLGRAVGLWLDNLSLLQGLHCGGV